MLPKYVWDNIAQENYLYNVGPERTDILSQENRLFQICLVAVFDRVQHHRAILALFVQCWLGSSFTDRGTTMNRGRLWLSGELLQYLFYRLSAGFFFHWAKRYELVHKEKITSNKQRETRKKVSYEQQGKSNEQR